ncbi:FIST C-terminal domain-containing protein [filamentous cyanobacterium LEGE 11480]|uniref:FIST C-terminal domain-containing protein n=1 Tax=Romeriopsis navalis LEGE 11480 TaxID=2777977 RepID=A0A928VPS4_9CYAN|nr:FIST N-terminal domain-containing protein [Romeriopsis navalis]MBE9032250.1 FIST C-terminal domain-containing protein [Romeriopsis navalis LEGE 11480]
MLQVVVGHSTDIDSDAAIAEVLEQCQAQLPGHSPQAGLLFAAIDFEHDLILDAIQQAFPGIALIGCTTDGEVSSVDGFQEDSLSLMLFCADGITIRAGCGRGLSTDPAAAAQQAVSRLDNAQLGPAKLCITLPDGIETGTEPALRQLQQLLPAGLPIVGGRAADQFRFEQTYQFFQGEVLQNSLPVLLFYGDLQVAHGVASGWQPLSAKALVTKSDGSIVHEIDGQPATDFFRRYLNDRPITGEYPLAVFEDAASDRFYLRAANQLADVPGSILFMGEVPEQSTVQLTHATSDQIISAAQTSIEQAVNDYPGCQPSAVLLFSCAARRWLLGNRAAAEYELLHQSLGREIPTIGFYANGEIGPLRRDHDTFCHQETLVTVLLGVE